MGLFSFLSKKEKINNDLGRDAGTGNAPGGDTALIAAALNGRLDVVRALLEKGVDVNVKYSDGKTALMAAAAQGHLDVVKVLLEKGADPNAKDSSGMTAVEISCYGGRLAVVRALLEMGADIDKRLAAVFHLTFPEIAELIEKGVDVKTGEVNLIRWKNSNWPKEWVEKHNYSWTHQDWQQLLEELQKSSYWPMATEKIGAVLEEINQRNRSRSTEYFEAQMPDGDGMCSDDDCPCGYPGATISRGAGYLYITQDVVDFRKDARSTKDAEAKIKRMKQSANVVFAPGTVAPILLCELGAKKRRIDLLISAADAKFAWETNKAPLRATPLAG